MHTREFGKVSMCMYRQISTTKHNEALLHKAASYQCCHHCDNYLPFLPNAPADSWCLLGHQGWQECSVPLLQALQLLFLQLLSREHFSLLVPQIESFS
jgi:hypothetical protein